MKTGRTTSKANPNEVRRSGNSHRKLSPKMKRRLRREKKKAKMQGLSCEHYRARIPNPAIDEEASLAGMCRAAYIERKSREQELRGDTLSRDTILAVLEETLEVEGRKYIGSEKAELEAMYNEDLGQLELFRFRRVVNEVNDYETEISLDAARESDPDSIVGDELGIKVVADYDKLSFVRILEAAEATRFIEPQVVFASVEGSEDLYQEAVERSIAIAAWYCV